VSAFKIDPETGERLGLLATATVGEGGWVDLKEAIIVRAGDAFIACAGIRSPDSIAGENADNRNGSSSAPGICGVFLRPGFKVEETSLSWRFAVVLSAESSFFWVTAPSLSLLPFSAL